ncbi:hypothetical protein AB9K34_19785 [Sedimentitalea sp. XS_ASV28]|uniref:hypothetical protein n=1 Tax=Sedimentitalea sp. XS_ASV28 TaxID=3241296 RepID=UPI0035179F86
MSTTSDKTSRSWVPAAIAGAVVGLVLLVAGSGPGFAVVGALVIFGLGVLLLPKTGTTETEVTREVAQPAPPEPRTAPVAAEPVAQAPTEPESQPVLTEETPPAPVAADSAGQLPGLSASTLVKASKALPGQTELAARKGTWRFENNSASA